MLPVVSVVTRCVFVPVSQTLSRLSCAYKKENQTKMVVCDLGNPMKGGTKVSALPQFSLFIFGIAFCSLTVVSLPAL